MMWRTAQSYKLYEKRLKEPEAQFKGNYPEWRLLDYWGSTMLSRILFGIGYVVLLYLLRYSLVDVPFITYPFFDGPYTRCYCKLVRS